MKSFLTMTYVKYLLYVLKIISCFGESVYNVSRTFNGYLEKVSKSKNCCLAIFGAYFGILLYMPHLLMISGAGYIVCVLWYYATLFPFFVLAFPLKLFFFGFNLYSFLVVSQSLASLYACFFPQIKKCMSGEIENIRFDNILQNLITFEIEPKQIMPVVPMLVQKRKKCYLDNIFFFLVIFALLFGSGLLLCPIFVVGDNYF